MPGGVSNGQPSKASWDTQIPSSFQKPFQQWFSLLRGFCWMRSGNQTNQFPWMGGWQKESQCKLYLPKSFPPFQVFPGVLLLLEWLNHGSDLWSISRSSIFSHLLSWPQPPICAHEICVSRNSRTSGWHYLLACWLGPQWRRRKEKPF